MTHYIETKEIKTLESELKELDTKWNELQDNWQNYKRNDAIRLEDSLQFDITVKRNKITNWHLLNDLSVHENDEINSHY